MFQPAPPPSFAACSSHRFSFALKIKQGARFSPNHSSRNWHVVRTTRYSATPRQTHESSIDYAIRPEFLCTSGILDHESVSDQEIRAQHDQPKGLRIGHHPLNASFSEAQEMAAGVENQRQERHRARQPGVQTHRHGHLQGEAQYQYADIAHQKWEGRTYSV